MFTISALKSRKTCNPKDILEITMHRRGNHCRGIGYHNGRLVMFEGDDGEDGKMRIKPITLRESVNFQAETHEEMAYTLFPDNSSNSEGYRKWYKALAAAIR